MFAEIGQHSVALCDHLYLQISTKPRLLVSTSSQSMILNHDSRESSYRKNSSHCDAREQWRLATKWRFLVQFSFWSQAHRNFEEGGGGGNKSTKFHHICDRTFCLICFSFMEETVGESVVRCSSGTIRIDWSKSTVKIEYWLHKRFLIHAKLNSLIVDLWMVNFIDHFQQSHSGVKTFLVNAFVYDLLQTTK